MEINNVIIFLGCVIFIFLIGKFFVVPLKWIIKLIGNSVLGAILIYIVNLIGGMYSFHIGLNVITTLTVGILGIPRNSITYNLEIISIVEKICNLCYNLCYQK